MRDVYFLSPEENVKNECKNLERIHYISITFPVPEASDPDVHQNTFAVFDVYIVQDLRFAKCFSQEKMFSLFVAKYWKGHTTLGPPLRGLNKQLFPLHRIHY
jgi:hypothetical protein